MVFTAGEELSSLEQRATRRNPVDLKLTTGPGYLTAAQKAEYDKMLAQKGELADKRVQTGQGSSVPSWTTKLAMDLYAQQTGNSDTTADVFGLAFLRTNILEAQERGEPIFASERMYGNALDQFYRNEDGSINYEAVHRDQFVAQVERVFYQNGGKVPLQFILDHAEDIDLLEGAGKDILVHLWDKAIYDQIQKERRASETEYWSVVADTYAAYRQSTVDDAIGYVVKNIEESVLNTDLIYTTAPWAGTDNISLSDLGDIGKAAWGEIKEKGASVWGWVGGILPWGAEVAGNGVEVIAGGDTGVINQQYLTPLADHLNPQRAHQAAQERARLVQESKMSEREYYLRAGLPGLEEIWGELPTINPEEYAARVEMAGGDSDLAKFFFMEDAQFSVQYRDEYEDYLKTSYEQYNKEVEYAIQELDANYMSVGDNILDLLGSYGNFVETIAVGTTLAGVALFDGKGMIFDDQYFQDLKNYDHPSDVLGINGTLTGLFFDLTLNGLVDPTNIFFMPGLSSAGRWGARNLDDVARIVNSSTERRLLEEALTIGRDPTRGTIANQSVLDVFETTGLYGDALSKIDGLTEGVARNLDVGTPIGLRSDSISLSLLDDLDILDDEVVKLLELDTGVLDDAGKVADEVQQALDELGMGHLAGLDPDARIIYQGLRDMTDDGVRTIEVTINPDTGQAAITKNAKYYAALKADGKQAGPVTIKMDPNFGKSSIADVPEAVLKAAPEIADEEKILQYGLDRWSKSGYADSQFTKRVLEVIEGKSEINPKVLESLSLDEQVALYKERIAARKVVEALQKGENTSFKQKGALLYRGHDFGEAIPKVGETFDAAVLPATRNPEVAANFYAVKQEGGAKAGAVLHFEKDTPGVGIFGPGKEVEAEVLTSGRFIVTDIQMVDGVPHVYIKRVEGVLDDVVTKGVDPNMSTAEWAKGVDPTLGKEVEKKGLYGRPRDIIPREEFLGEANFDELKALYEQHLRMGGDPLTANRLALAVQVGKSFGDLVRKHGGEIGEFLDAFFSPINANSHFAFTGTYATAQINQFGARLWSAVDDLAGWEHYQRMIHDFWRARGIARGQADTLSAEYLRVKTQIDAIESLTGGVDDMAKALGTETSEAGKAVKATTKAEREALQKELDDIMAKQRQLSREMNDYQRLTRILDDMMEDYNRKHLASNPKWKDFVNEETGLVDWESVIARPIQRETRDVKIMKRAQAEGISMSEAAERELGFIPDEIKIAEKTLERTGLTTEQFIEKAIEALDHRGSWVAPASPLEIMAAATGGPNAVRSVTARYLGQGVEDFFHAAHMAWVLDKVFTPRTGITVSLDELVFGWHKGGYRNVLQYLEDKAMGVADSVTSIKGVAAWEHLPKRWKDRVSALEQYPIYLKQQERAFLELNGYGFDTIKYKKYAIDNNQAYYDAAQRTTQIFLNDPGMQAYLEGPEAFAKWLAEDATAARARNIEYIDLATGAKKAGPRPEDIEEGYKTVLEWAMHKIPKKDRAKALEYWRQGAREAAEKGSTKAGPTVLPDWVLEGYGAVTGNLNKPRGVMGKIGNAASEAIFQKPLAYRRGFNAEWVRQSERARLMKLYESQGISVVSEQELYNIARTAYPGMSDAVLNTLLPSMDAELFNMHKVVSERWVRELIETKVVHEIENMQYSFTMASRAGRKVTALAPFGKPYADMVGRWTREIFARPQLRGWINDTNLFNMSKIANEVVDALPFNPRTVGFLSRIANTDFDLDRIQEDPIFGGLARAVGMDSLDVGAGLFLPHSGENPFNVLLPGLGILPIGILGQVMQMAAPDPVEDPVAYQKFIDEWAEFVPSLAYSNPQGLIQGIGDLVLGGGTTARSVKMAEAGAQMITGNDYGAAAMSQNWSSRINANLRVKQIFSDPDTLKELSELPPGITEAGLSAFLDEKLAEITKQANREAGLSAFAELGVETLAPVRVKFDNQSDDLNTVWLESTDILGLELPSYIKTGTPEQDAQAANWVRSQFFDMPDYKRDALIAKHPQLAVNMVSMWKWTDRGLNADLPNNDVPYRTDGSTIGLERHQTYKEKGWIQPMAPLEIARNIIGTQASAKARAARETYSEAARIVNDERWELVPDEWKDWLDATAAEAVSEGLLPYRSGKELWKNEADLKRVMDHLFPPEEGETGFSIPDKYSAWGETMPGSPDQLRTEFETAGDGGWYLDAPTDKLLTLADAIGVEFDGEKIYMKDVYTATANALAESRLNNPIFQEVEAAYLAWLNPRSAGLQATNSAIGQILDHSQFDDETRFQYKSSMIYVSEALDRRAMGDPSWRLVRDDAAARFARMFQDDAFRNLDAKALWDQAYGRSLGSLDWEPDEPPPLFEEGNANPNASEVYVRRVLDGDTLDVAFGVGIHGSADVYRVRLLGWNAQELGNGGEPERDNLRRAIEDAIDNGMPISIVRDPDRYGETDMYGRIFAWLYIGEEPWYNPDTMLPRSD